jgi:hypothetical protein
MVTASKRKAIGTKIIPCVAFTFSRQPTIIFHEAVTTNVRESDYKSRESA